MIIACKWHESLWDPNRRPNGERTRSGSETTGRLFDIAPEAIDLASFLKLRSQDLQYYIAEFLDILQGWFLLVECSSEITL